MTAKSQNRPEAPMPRTESASERERLPASVTFFVTRGERTALLRRLRARDANDRAAALLSALGVRRTEG